MTILVFLRYRKNITCLKPDSMTRLQTDYLLIRDMDTLMFDPRILLIGSGYHEMTCPLVWGK